MFPFGHLSLKEVRSFHRLAGHPGKSLSQWKVCCCCVHCACVVPSAGWTLLLFELRAPYCLSGLGRTTERATQHQDHQEIFITKKKHNHNVNGRSRRIISITTRIRSLSLRHLLKGRRISLDSKMPAVQLKFQQMNGRKVQIVIVEGRITFNLTRGSWGRFVGRMLNVLQICEKGPLLFSISDLTGSGRPALLACTNKKQTN